MFYIVNADYKYSFKSTPQTSHIAALIPMCPTLSFSKTTLKSQVMSTSCKILSHQFSHYSWLHSRRPSADLLYLDRPCTGFKCFPGFPLKFNPFSFRGDATLILGKLKSLLLSFITFTLLWFDPLSEVDYKDAGSTPTAKWFPLFPSFTHMVYLKNI